MKRKPKAVPLVIMVVLTERQQQQLLDVSDELGIPLHQVGEAAIVSFLETYGHHRKGSVRKPKAKDA